MYKPPSTLQAMVLRFHFHRHRRGHDARSDALPAARCPLVGIPSQGPCDAPLCAMMRGTAGTLAVEVTAGHTAQATFVAVVPVADRCSSRQRA